MEREPPTARRGNPNAPRRTSDNDPGHTDEATTPTQMIAELLDNAEADREEGRFALDD